MTSSAHEQPGFVADSARQRQILIASCVALMAVVASASGLNVAQQQLALDLDASQSDVLWVINAYVVTLAAFLLPMGAIADSYGRKPVLMVGLLAFAVVNGAAAFVSTTEAMIAVRAAAGLAAAMVMPVTLSVITSTFPPEARSQAIGVWSGVAGGGGLLGMIAAALLSDLADWRWLFAVPVVLAVAGLTLTARSVPNTREPQIRAFDLAGAVLSVAAIGGLVLGIHEGPTRGWADGLTLSALAVGLVTGALFVAHELRSTAPLLDVRELRQPWLAAGSSTLLFVFAISGGIFVVLFPFFQAVLGWSALGSMAGLLPLIVLMMGASALSATLAARVGRRVTMLVGVAGVAAGLALMALLVSDGYLSVLPGMLVMGLGMGLTMPPATESITSSLPAHRQGVASALNDTTRELGSALGIALLGAVLASSYASAIRPALAAAPAGAQGAEEGIARAFDIAAAAPDAGLAEQLREAARQAFISGWGDAMWAGAAVMVALLVFLIVRVPKAPHEPAADLVLASSAGDLDR